MMLNQSVSIRRSSSIQVLRGQRLRVMVEHVLAAAGIRIDGDRPEDIRVRDERFFAAAVTRGFTGVRDAYVEGWWDTQRLDVVTQKVLERRLEIPYASQLTLAVAEIAGRLSNRQSSRRAFHIRRHYDLGDDLFSAMLDRRKNYSCAYWKTATNLDEAQEAKLDLVCHKLGLRPGMRVLDIGCGWGGFARFAAERYGVSVVGITVSLDQAREARATCAGLPVEIRMRDYRDLARWTETFDAIASIGMLEHVGHKNYPRYMQLVARLLRNDGLFLLQVIGGNTSMTTYDPWMNEHIFPNAHLPSVRQLARATEGVLIVEDWHNFGPDYDPTLLAWHANFERGWPALRSHYGERFRRMWNCYLLTCAGSFRARENQLWQVVLAKPGRVGRYEAAR